VHLLVVHSFKQDNVANVACNVSCSQVSSLTDPCYRTMWLRRPRSKISSHELREGNAGRSASVVGSRAFAAYTRLTYACVSFRSG
jgi:hypothetical protein